MHSTFTNLVERAKGYPGFMLSKLKRSPVKPVVVNGELFHKYKGELFPDYLNHGNACQFIAEKAASYCKGVGIDIGASRWPLPGATPIQDEPHLNAYNLGSFADNSLDFVFSSHCLEHLDRWQQALSLWISKLKPGGILFLYLPHESMKLWNPGAPWVADGHKWMPKHEVLLPFLSENGVQVVEFNADRDKYWSFHIVGKKSVSEAASA